MSSSKIVFGVAVGVAAIGAILLIAEAVGYKVRKIRLPGGFSVELSPSSDSDEAEYRKVEDDRRLSELATAKREAEEATRIAERKSAQEYAARLEAERKLERLQEKQAERPSREEMEERLSPAPQVSGRETPAIQELPTIVVPADEPPAVDEWEGIVRKPPPVGVPPWIGADKGYRQGYPYLTWRGQIRPGRKDEYGTPGTPGTARDNLPPSCINSPGGQPLEMCPQ